MSIRNIFSDKIFLRFFVLIFVIGVLSGFGSFYFFSSKSVDCSISYKYLNPHLSCKDKIFIKKISYLSLEDNLRNYFNSEKSSGRLADAGVFFRDLEDGPILDIDANKLFISASLIKLPTIMTVMRIAEQYPDFLNKKVLYDKEISSENQDFVPDYKLKLGERYSVEELVSRTLQYSDNASNSLLVNEIINFSPKEDMIFNTFKDLGLVLPGDVSQRDLSTRSYSSLLRLLYNSSFLSKNSSNKILELLDKAGFKQGIEGGVPENVRVATKFGERELEYVSKEGKFLKKVDELHDCGIVYYPNNPYLLCIMTRGKDFNELSNVILNVSRMVYEEITSRAINSVLN